MLTSSPMMFADDRRPATDNGILEVRVDFTQRGHGQTHYQKRVGQHHEVDSTKICWPVGGCLSANRPASLGCSESFYCLLRVKLVFDQPAGASIEPEISKRRTVGHIASMVLSTPFKPPWIIWDGR